MKNLEIGLQVASDTRSMALRAVKEFSSFKFSHQIVCKRAIRPVDHTRYAGCDAILRDLELNPGMKIRDVSRPRSKIWRKVLIDRSPLMSGNGVLNVSCVCSSNCHQGCFIL